MDVGEREVAGDQRPLHHQRGDRRSGEAQAGVDRRLAQQPAVARPHAEHRDDHATGSGGESEDDAGLAECGVGAYSEHRPLQPRRAVQLGARVGLDAVGVGRLVFVGVLDLDLVALEHAVDEAAVDDDGLAFGEDPARLALVAHGDGGIAEHDGERRDARGGLDGPVGHGPLHAQPTTRLTAVADTDLVGVAVVVDRRAEELGDDQPAGGDHGNEHADRCPVTPLAGVAAACGGGRRRHEDAASVADAHRSRF